MTKSKVPSLVSIAILTLVTSVSWVSFTVYRIFTEKPAPKVAPEILEPISPELDSNQIDKIEARIFFEDNQIPDNLSSVKAEIQETNSVVSTSSGEL